MSKKTLLKHLVFLMFFVFGANSVALKLHLYYSVWWFDILMHLLAGFWVGLFFIYVFYTKKLPLSRPLAIILSVLSIGVAWEFFEYYLSVIAYDSWDLIDTFSDLFFDLAGGICAILYVYKKIMPATGDAL